MSLQSKDVGLISRGTGDRCARTRSSLQVGAICSVLLKPCSACKGSGLKPIPCARHSFDPPTMDNSQRDVTLFHALALYSTSPRGWSLKWQSRCLLEASGGWPGGGASHARCKQWLRGVARAPRGSLKRAASTECFSVWVLWICRLEVAARTCICGGCGPAGPSRVASNKSRNCSVSLRSSFCSLAAPRRSCEFRKARRPWPDAVAQAEAASCRLADVAGLSRDVSRLCTGGGGTGGRDWGVARGEEDGGGTSGLVAVGGCSSRIHLGAELAEGSADPRDNPWCLEHRMSVSITLTLRSRSGMRSCVSSRVLGCSFAASAFTQLTRESMPSHRTFRLGKGCCMRSKKGYLGWINCAAIAIRLVAHYQLAWPTHQSLYKLQEHRISRY